MTEDAYPELALDTGAKEAMAQVLAGLTRLRIVDALGKRLTKGPESTEVGVRRAQATGGGRGVRKLRVPP